LGVNVYRAEPKVPVLITEGDQVPVTGDILLELVGNMPGVLFKQNGPNGLNVGVIGAVTATFILAVEAHCPALGVNVYTVLPEILVLITAGDQLPVIGVTLVEVSGRVPGIEFWQYGPSCVKVGAGGGDIVIDMEVTDPH